MNRVQGGFYEVDDAVPIETYCFQLDAKVSDLSQSKTGGRNNALSGEAIFLGSSNVDEERSFTGVTSFLRDGKVLTQATDL
jgi:hypothetical protein